MTPPQTEAAWVLVVVLGVLAAWAFWAWCLWDEVRAAADVDDGEDWP